MTQGLRAQLTAISLFAALMFTAGCKTDQQKAVDQAKAQAASTQTPQQVQYVDNNGDTVTTTVAASRRWSAAAGGDNNHASAAWPKATFNQSRCYAARHICHALS